MRRVVGKVGMYALMLPWMAMAWVALKLSAWTGERFD